MFARLKRELFLKEFPFLANFANPEEIVAVKVASIDEELLAHEPYYIDEKSYGNSRVLLLDKSGKLVDEVAQKWRPRNHVKGFFQEFSEKYLSFCNVPPPPAPPDHKDHSVKGECVAEALLRLESVADRIFYILELKFIGPCASYPRGEVMGLHLILSKPPKKFTLKEWLDTAVLHEKKTLKKSIYEIDAEAETLPPKL